jgi:hypothetical protein
MTILGFRFGKPKKVMSTVYNNTVPAIWKEIHVHYMIAGRSNIPFWPYSRRFINLYLRRVRGIHYRTCAHSPCISGTNFVWRTPRDRYRNRSTNLSFVSCSAEVGQPLSRCQRSRIAFEPDQPRYLDFDSLVGYRHTPARSTGSISPFHLP